MLFIGFFGSGKVCAPIDPCEYHKHDINANCVPNATIIDENSHECQFEDGFNGNGYVCNVNVSPCTGHVCGHKEVGQVVTN